jgi:hypothetical protein
MYVANIMYCIVCSSEACKYQTSARMIEQV